MNTIRTNDSCFDVLWSKKDDIISKFADRFGNIDTGVKNAEIRIVTRFDSYKLVFSGYEGKVPNDTKYFNKVQLKLYHKMSDRREYTEITSRDFDVKGLLLDKSQLRDMVKSCYYYILGSLYNYEVINEASWAEYEISRLGENNNI